MPWNVCTEDPLGDNASGFFENQLQFLFPELEYPFFPDQPIEKMCGQRPLCDSLSECLGAMELSLKSHVEMLGDNVSENLYDLSDALVTVIVLTSSSAWKKPA